MLSVCAALPPVLGNLHLLLLHLPIGLAVAAVLVEAWTWRDPTGRALVGKLLATNAVLAVLTATAGLVLAAQGDYPAGPLAWHRWTGVGCALIAVLAWWLRARRGLNAGRLGLVLMVIATGIAGHLGATLTHGDGLMEWRVPAAGVEHSVGSAPAPAAHVAGAPAGGVHPLILEHCVACHGPKKQKGQLRLDTLVAARAQGRSGEPALVPGDVEASELLRRVNLPRSDEDTMPPGDLRALSSEEREELAAWVRSMLPN